MNERTASASLSVSVSVRLHAVQPRKPSAAIARGRWTFMRARQGAAMESTISKRNEALLGALSKHATHEANYPIELFREDDLKSLFLNVLHVTGREDKVKYKDEVMKWVEFASTFSPESGSPYPKLEVLNEELTQKSVLLGYGLRMSEADIIVYSALHSFMSHTSNSERQKFPNLMRWLDYVQNKEDFGESLERLSVEKTEFEPCVKKASEKADIKPSKNTLDLGKKETIEVKTHQTKATSEACEDKKETNTKKLVTQKESADKDTDMSVSLLNIQVGLIRKAWKHPSADSLLVEEIDLGDGNLRQVVSGLAKHCTPEQLTNRLVVLVTNVKPGKLRDVMSAGLVLCASNQDQTVVEPLLPPERAKPGERVLFSGFEGKPEDVLNPKKKQLEKITPHLYTDDKGVATFKGTPFMTSCGPCTSSILNAGIK